MSVALIENRENQTWIFFVNISIPRNSWVYEWLWSIFVHEDRKIDSNFRSSSFSDVSCQGPVYAHIYVIVCVWPERGIALTGNEHGDL